MKVRNGDILQAKPVVEAMLKMPASELTVRGKYTVAKLGRKLSGPLADIEAARVKLVQQHGEKTEQGYEVKASALQAFQVDLTEVLEMETEINWDVVTLTDLDATALTGEEIMVLDKFVVFPEPPEK